MGILERLQSEVESDNAVHQRTLQDTEEMLERVSTYMYILLYIYMIVLFVCVLSCWLCLQERGTNRGLQEELRKERETSSSMKGVEERLEEAESRLKEVEHQYELSKQVCIVKWLIIIK